MSKELNNNIKLWFAKDKNGEVVTIYDYDSSYDNELFMCPMCQKEVKPRALNSEKVSRHFYHVEESKCNEDFTHWWIKNVLILPNQEIKVIADQENTYIVKEVYIEKPYKTTFGIYKPDITIIAEDNTVIYLEIFNKNKKNLFKYIDKWDELKGIVCEISVEDVSNLNFDFTFEATYYDSNTYNIDKYDLISDDFKSIFAEDFTKDEIKNIIWFLSEMCKYNRGERNIEEILNYLYLIEEKQINIILAILRNSKCSNFMKDYKALFTETINNVVNKYNLLSITPNKYPLKVYERFFNEFKITLNDGRNLKTKLNILKLEGFIAENMKEDNELIEKYQALKEENEVKYNEIFNIIKEYENKMNKYKENSNYYENQIKLIKLKSIRKEYKHLTLIELKQINKKNKTDLELQVINELITNKEEELEKKKELERKEREKKLNLAISEAIKGYDLFLEEFTHGLIQKFGNNISYEKAGIDDFPHDINKLLDFGIIEDAEFLNRTKKAIKLIRYNENIINSYQVNKFKSLTTTLLNELSIRNPNRYKYQRYEYIKKCIFDVKWERGLYFDIIKPLNKHITEYINRLKNVNISN